MEKVEQKNKSEPIILQKDRDTLVQVIQTSAASGGLLATERALAGVNLAKLGDPRREVMGVDNMSFCWVPGGSFYMGKKDTEESAEEVSLPEFWIAQYLVTQAQFNIFIKAGGYAEERFWIEALQIGVWESGKVQNRDRQPDFGSPFNLPNFPVMGLTWYEARAFCRWLEEYWREKRWLPENWRVQLPSESEWEKAARGGREIPAKPFVSTIDKIGNPQHEIPLCENPQPKRAYPWGNDFNPEKANTEETGIGTTSVVGCFPAGISPYGAFDLSGNAWEWTRSPYHANNPSKSESTKTNDLSSGQKPAWVMRGGAFSSGCSYACCADRPKYILASTLGYGGFRVGLFPPEIRRTDNHNPRE